MSFSLAYERDTGTKSFLEDMFECEERLPGMQWKAAAVQWTDIVSTWLLSTFGNKSFPRHFSLVLTFFCDGLVNERFFSLAKLRAWVGFERRSFGNSVLACFFNFCTVMVMMVKDVLHFY